MRTLTRFLTLIVVVASLALGVAAPRPSAAPAPAALEGGAASMEGLVAEFLAALEGNDAQALQRLRVTEREYRGLVVPGNVPRGEPPQIPSEEASRYFWQILDQKSHHYQELLLRRFGGDSLAVKDVSFEKGHKEYAGHQAWRQLVLVVADDGGRDRVIRTGSIIERDGRFKFVSFIRD